jgi:hypothetical protein
LVNALATVAPALAAVRRDLKFLVLTSASPC